MIIRSSLVSLYPVTWCDLSASKADPLFGGLAVFIDIDTQTFSVFEKAGVISAELAPRPTFGVLHSHQTNQRELIHHPH